MCEVLFAQVCEWSMKVHAAGTGGVLGKEAIKKPHDAGLDKQCTV
jgi:hypothetical protein